MFTKVKEILSEVNLPMDGIVEQCYDGAANMKGKNKGLATGILNVNPKAFYVHCYYLSIYLTWHLRAHAAQFLRSETQLGLSHQFIHF